MQKQFLRPPLITVLFFVLHSAAACVSREMAANSSSVHAGPSQGVTPDQAEKIRVDGPTIVGFFPSVKKTDVENDDSTREGLAHLQFALENVAKCLEGKGVSIRLSLADRLIFEDRHRSVEFRLTDHAFNEIGRASCRERV